MYCELNGLFVCVIQPGTRKQIRGMCSQVLGIHTTHTQLYTYWQHANTITQCYITLRSTDTSNSMCSVARSWWVFVSFVVTQSIYYNVVAVASPPEAAHNSRQQEFVINTSRQTQNTISADKLAWQMTCAAAHHDATHRCVDVFPANRLQTKTGMGQGRVAIICVFYVSSFLR